MPQAAVSNPRTLQAWLQHLEPLQPPIDAKVRSAAMQELGRGTGSAGSAAQILLADPAQVLLLFRAANSALARYERVAHTLEHAISLLGVSRVQKLLQEAVPLSAHPQADHYRQALLRSLHAAWQARLWADGSGRWPAEEVFWSTLLAAAPQWLLWLEAGPQLQQLEKLRAQQGAVSAVQQRRTLGCTPAELGAELAQRWLLPEMSRLAWRSEAAGTPRQWLGLARSARLDSPPVITENGLNELCHHPALVVALANALADAADWDWQSKHTLRLLGIAASACRRPLSTLISSSHQAAAALSREYSGAQLTPGARLLGYWRQAQLWPPRPRPQRTAAAPTSADKPVPAPAGNEQVLVATVKRLRSGAIDSPRAALELAVAAMHQGIGLRRAAVFLYRAGSRELQTMFSAGTEQAPALRQLRCQPRQNGLIAHLLEKPACLRLDADNRTKYWQHLPAELRSAAGEAFLLMAVFAGTRPVAMLYADNGAGTAPGDTQHRLFKQLCQELTRCLSRLSEPPAPAP